MPWIKAQSFFQKVSNFQFFLIISYLESIIFYVANFFKLKMQGLFYSCCLSLYTYHKRILKQYMYVSVYTIIAAEEMYNIMYSIACTCWHAY